MGFTVTRPYVSVIMNCRNSSEFLREAIDSVFAQSFDNWEIVFWDNQSTDLSPEIAQSYRTEEDSGKQILRYFRAAEPAPLGLARNLAIKKARGDLVAFLDCDDLWAPDKLARQVELFQANPALGLVCTDTKIVKGEETLSLMFETARPFRGEVFAELIAAGWISMSSAVVSMKALNSLSHWFDPAFNVAEEADLFYRIAHDWELDYVDAPLTSWRVHGTNTTFAKFEQFAVETRQILAKLEKLYPGLPEEYPDLIPLLERRAVFQTAVALWRQGKNRAARQEISPHLFSGGGGVKFLAFWLLSWLPGSAFDALARVYLKLPKFLRR